MMLRVSADFDALKQVAGRFSFDEFTEGFRQEAAVPVVVGLEGLSGFRPAWVQSQTGLISAEWAPLLAGDGCRVPQPPRGSDDLVSMSGRF